MTIKFEKYSPTHRGQVYGTVSIRTGTKPDGKKTPTARIAPDILDQLDGAKYVTLSWSSEASAIGFEYATKEDDFSLKVSHPDRTVSLAGLARRYKLDPEKMNGLHVVEWQDDTAFIRLGEVSE